MSLEHNRNNCDIITSAMSASTQQVDEPSMSTNGAASVATSSTNATAGVATPSSDTQPSNDNAALIGGIVGGIVALLLVGGLIAFLVARTEQ
jgi:predicted lipid-binding transport protein (Tim44 family)